MDLRIPLYGQQRQLISTPEPEVLAAGAGGGKSHALRVAALDYALVHGGLRIVLLHPRADELSREHVEGRTGLKALLSPLSHVVRFSPEGVIFPTGSRITWLAADRPADLRRLTEERVDLLLIDELHRLPRELYDALVVKVEVSGGRILAAAPGLEDAGWVAERFGNGAQGRALIRTSADDLPDGLRAVAAEPTLEQHMDGLGMPFLAAGSDYRRKPYVRTIVDVLQRWFWAQLPPRLWIFIHTQAGKTLLGVRVFSSYFLRCRPQETIGIACHAALPARYRNRDVRNFYAAAGGPLGKTVDQDYWQTSYGGGAWAVGAGGGTGNPASLLINDDLDKEPAESRSAAHIRRKDDWYAYTWLGREAKTASRGELMLLGVATRVWSSDTPSRIIRYHVDKGEPVHVLALPALYTPVVADHYQAIDSQLVTTEPDFRSEEGEPIDPDHHEREHWESIERAKPHVFWSRDQQKPQDAGGGLTFDEEWPIDIASDPAFVPGVSEKGVYFRPVRAWDLAATAGGGHYTASVKLGEARATERVIIRHAVRARYGTRDVLRFIAAMAFLDGSEVVIVLPEDPAAGGAHQTERIIEYVSDACRQLTIPCPDCRGGQCPDCGGTGRLRFRRPLLRTVPTKGADQQFEDLAARATPRSEHVEGEVDYVRAEWTPRLREAIPWLGLATEAMDETWRTEFREMERIVGEVTEACARWWVEMFREFHLFPNSDFDDWTSAVSYGWAYLSGPRSVYPVKIDRE